MTKIITFHGKYGDESFDASDNAAVSRACASVIKQRYNDGWYYAPTEPKPLSKEDQAVFDLTREDLLEIPEFLRDEVTLKRAHVISRRKAAWKRYETDLEDWNAIQKIASAPTLEEAASYEYNYPKTPKARPSSLAFWVIDGHSDWEYEGYSFDTLSTPRW